MSIHPVFLGETRVDRLLDGVFETGRDALTHSGGEVPLNRTLDLWGDRPFRMDVNCFLLRGPRGTELVDAGTGPSWGAHLGHARQALQESGVAPDAVDRIFLTHIHGDHALGLLDGDGAYFPNAELIVSDTDLTFFTDAAERNRLPERRRSGFAIADQLIGAYGDRLHRAPFGPLLPGVDLLPLAGHTPGHGGYLFRAADEALLLLGDALHLGDLQAADPDVGLIFDLDPATAVTTRRAILARAATGGWTVGGGHLPSFSRVVEDGDGFRIDPI